METDLISLWRRAQLSLTPWHWEDRQQSFTALLHGRDPLNTVLTGGIFSSSSSSTGISFHTFHTSARSDHSCHGSAFCSTSELIEQRHTDSLTDEAEDSQQGLAALSAYTADVSLLHGPSSAVLHGSNSTHEKAAKSRGKKAQAGSVLWKTIKRVQRKDMCQYDFVSHT